MFGQSDSIFGDDGMLPAGYGAAPPTTVIPRGVQQMPGTVVVAESAIHPSIPQVPGTVVVAAPAMPQGVPQVPGTVVVAEAALPKGVPQVPGTVVAPAPVTRAPVQAQGARPLTLPAGTVMAPPSPAVRVAGPLPTAGRGGYSIAGGLPPLPTGAPPLPGGHLIRGAQVNMPLPGRPIYAPAYPSDVAQFGIRDGWSRQGATSRSQLGAAWGAADTTTYRDYRSANYASDGYVYRVYVAAPGQPIDVFKNGKVVAAKITASSSPAAYSAIMGELQGQKRADPALIVTAINAATLVATSAIQATAPHHHKRRKKFDSGPLSVPPADPVSTGVPTWVWVAGGGVALLGLGWLVFGGKKSGESGKAAA